MSNDTLMILGFLVFVILIAILWAIILGSSR